MGVPTYLVFWKGAFYFIAQKNVMNSLGKTKINTLRTWRHISFTSFHYRLRLLQKQQLGTKLCITSRSSRMPNRLTGIFRHHFNMGESTTLLSTVLPVLIKSLLYQEPKTLYALVNTRDTKPYHCVHFQAHSTTHLLSFRTKI